MLTLLTFTFQTGCVFPVRRRTRRNNTGLDTSLDIYFSSLIRFPVHGKLMIMILNLKFQLDIQQENK